MTIAQELRKPSWAAAFGTLLFIGMMATGYFYNVTFMQLGVLDLGTRLVGLAEGQVAALMAGVALVTALVAIAFGLLMQRLGWGLDFTVKLRLAFAVAIVQAALTLPAPLIRHPAVLISWLAAVSVGLGIGVPVTFSLVVDLVRVRDRPWVAAAITGAAYFAAAVLASPWRIERFTTAVALPMLGGIAILAFLVFARPAFLAKLAEQHRRLDFGLGRLVDRAHPGGLPRRLLVALGLMFGVFFVDSLGFIRIIATPGYVSNAWQSSDSSTLLFIGVTHVVAAMVGGALYASLNIKSLFLWIFGLFALVQAQYVFAIRIGGGERSLAMPMLYAGVVSLYTVVNFSIWADLSTPRTISRNTALGVAVSGWTASFLSSALALAWRTSGIPVVEHLANVAAVATLLFLVTAGLWVAQAWRKEPGRRVLRIGNLEPPKGKC